VSCVLATYNIKGGVGKTSTAVNLSYLAARDGHRTLLWDIDPQSSSTYIFRVKPRVEGGGRRLLRLRSPVRELIKGTDFERLDLLPADFSYRHFDLTLDAFRDPAQRLARVLAPVRDDYDYIFLDCPPSISLVSESVFATAQALLVPVIPATLSTRIFEQLETLAAGGPALLAFISMSDARKPLHRDQMARLRSIHRLTMLGAAIPLADDVERMGEERNPVAEFASGSPAAISYEALWLDVQRRIGASAAAAGDAAPAAV
jgi:chromosome partitioning protein